MADVFRVTIVRRGDDWVFSCSCGWADRWPTYARWSLDKRSRANGGIRHLERAHGRQDSEHVEVRDRRNGNTSVVLDRTVDQRLLDKNEGETYRTLVDLRVQPKARRPWTAFRGTALTFTVWAGMLVLAAYAQHQADSHGSDEPWVALLVVVLFGGAAAVIAAKVAEERQWRSHLANDYLASIRFDERVLRDDVRYRSGEAYRKVFAGYDSDVEKIRGRYVEVNSTPVYRWDKVAYEEVPAAGEKWADELPKPRTQTSFYFDSLRDPPNG